MPSHFIGMGIKCREGQFKLILTKTRYGIYISAFTQENHSYSNIVMFTWVDLLTSMIVKNI
ncbi:hypothetical protein NIES22_45640 [Calothrix brevissima NIES-22]|nr:hypothetical protein NIES22_45640 [Calothrix brevissima NIES-22]